MIGLNQSDITVSRRAADGYDADGNGVKGAQGDPVAARAAVQPVSGATLRDMPEGLRTSAVYQIFTRFDLQVDDVVTYAGDTFRVSQVWARRQHEFTKAVVGNV